MKITIFYTLTILFLFTSAPMNLIAAQSPLTKQPPASKASKLQFKKGSSNINVGPNHDCFITSPPFKRTPPSASVSAKFYVSTRQSDKIFNEVSIYAGFNMKEGSEQTIEIGRIKFKLVASGPNMWVANLADSPKIINAMKSGTNMTVRAKSAKDKSFSDMYDLSGFSDALEFMQQNCR